MIGLFVEGKKIELLLDTGFNGHLMLPKTIIKELGLDPIGISDYLTASGENRPTNVYTGKVVLLNREIEVPILSTDADFSLAGMELLHGYRIVIERKKDILGITKSN